jgi:hypothetical protein
LARRRCGPAAEDSSPQQEPTHIFCEIRIGSETQFTPICDFESCVYDLAQPDESGPYLHEELPGIWQRDFAEMARRWAECDYLLKFGSTELPRYAEEQVSSRDANESGTPTLPAEDVLRTDQEGASEA